MCLLEHKHCKHAEKICYKVMRTNMFGLTALWGPHTELHRYRIGWTYTAKPQYDDRMHTPYIPGFHAYARLRDAVTELGNTNDVMGRGKPVIVKVRLIKVHTKGRDVSWPGEGEVPAYVASQQQILKVYQPRELERYKRNRK